MAEFSEKPRSFQMFRQFGMREHVYRFLENLLMLLAAGINIIEGLRSVREGVDSRRMRRILDEMIEDMENGYSLHHAMAQTGVFPERIMSLVKVGESSGRLAENMEVIVLQNEKDAVFRSKMRSSLLYIGIVSSMAFIVGICVAWFALPALTGFFADLDVELPPITKGLVAIGDFFGTYGYFAVPLMIMTFALSVYFLFMHHSTKRYGNYILLRTPIVRRLVRQTEIARFGYVFGTMIENGVPLGDILRTLKTSTTFMQYQDFYEFLGQYVEEGHTLRDGFKLYPKVDMLFPPSVQQMVGAAEKSGHLSDSLLRIGRTFETRIESTARNLPIIIEPILLLVIGVLVVLIALGVIMPIYSLSNSVF